MTEPSTTPAAGQLPTTQQLADLPSWNGDRRQLWFDGTLCRQYKPPALSQELVLQSFQELGWPKRIDDPLPPGKLEETVKNMRRIFAECPITFGRDGTGKGIVWIRAQ
jgi:hypothetical protein